VRAVDEALGVVDGDDAGIPAYGFPDGMRSGEARRVRLGNAGARFAFTGFDREQRLSGRAAASGELDEATAVFQASM
jgi:hypothetical protein